MSPLVYRLGIFCFKNSFIYLFLTINFDIWHMDKDIFLPRSVDRKRQRNGQASMKKGVYNNFSSFNTKLKSHSR